MGKKTKKTDDKSDKLKKPKKPSQKGMFRGLTIRDVFNMTEEQVNQLPNNLKGIAKEARYEHGISKIPYRCKRKEDRFYEE